MTMNACLGKGAQGKGRKMNNEKVKEFCSKCRFSRVRGKGNPKYISSKVCINNKMRKPNLIVEVAESLYWYCCVAIDSPDLCNGKLFKPKPKPGIGRKSTKHRSKGGSDE